MGLGFFRRRFLENPLVGRQLATQLTGPRLGFVFLFVAGSLLLADIITFSSVLLSDRAFALEGHAGGILYAVNALVLYGLLACLLPIRVSGAIDGPRFDKAFDQLVVTGASPIQLALGNWALGFFYAVFVLLISAPFQVYAYMLGGVDFSNLLYGYGVLALYANVIIAVTLASSVLEREWLSVPATIGLFWLAGFLSFAPLPSVFAWGTPVRYFLHPALLNPQVYLGAPPWFFGDPVLFLYAVPLKVYPFVLWLLIVLPCIVLILLGPSHRFLPGLNNFGNVVLPGDRKRRFFRKMRYALTRKVELAFFYENRPRWLDGWDFALRAVMGLGFVAFAWAVITGICFDGAPALDSSLDFWRDGRFGVSIGLTAGVLFLAILALGDPRFKLEWRERLGKRSVPRGWLLSLCVMVLLLGFVLLHRTMLDAALANAPSKPPIIAAGRSVETYSMDFRQFIGSLMLVLFNCHLLGKILTRISPTAGAWRVQLLLAAGAVLCGPLILTLGMQERWIPQQLFPLIFISPFSQMLVRDAAFKRIAPQGFKPDDAFGQHIAWQLGITALLAVALVSIVLLTWAWRTRSSRSALLKGPAAAGVRAVLAALLLPAIAGTLRAEPNKVLPIEATLTYGFEGQLFEAGASFFTLVLRNTSGKSILGTCRVDFDGRFSSPPREFEAPPGTTAPLRWSDVQNTSVYFYLGNIRVILDAPEGSLSIPVTQPILAAQNAPSGTSRYLVVSEEGRQPITEREQLQAWIYTRPLFLPEDHLMYAHATTIFVGPTDLSRWTQGQRHALYDFVRLGGAVVFHGRIDRASLKGAGDWEEILAPRSSSRVARDGVEYQIEDLEDSQPVVWLDATGDQQTIPLLSVRLLGLGSVGHLSCDLTSASLDKPTWKSLWEGMPQSHYPAGLSRSHQDDLELRDSTSLFAVLSYFTFYALVAGPVGFFLFRRKSRRRWLPVWMIALPASFVLLLPALHASLHLRSSYATLTRVAFFGPGARRGVAMGRVEVRSSGRQRHALKLRGENLSAFAMDFRDLDDYSGSGHRRSLQLPLVLNAAGDGAQVLELSLNPWGRKDVLFVADVRRGAPVQGKALFNQQTKRLSLEASGLPSPGGKIEGQVVLRLPGETQCRSANLSSAAYSDGTLTLELATDPVSTEISNVLRTQPLPLSRLAIDLPSRPYVFLALEVADAGLALETKDLAFEREVEPMSLERPAKGKTKKKDDPESQRGIVERGGKLFRSFERTLILQELPLEIR